MKILKFLLLSTIIFVSFFFCSCAEYFSPKIDYSEKDILYAVFEANGVENPARQFAVVSKTYDVNGYNPATNTVDPNDTNSVVSIFIKDKEYPFELDSTRRMDTTRYNDKMYYYALINAGLVLRSNDNITITAKLPNGKVLTANSTVPPNLTFDYSYDYSRGFTADLSSFTVGNTWDISWDMSENGHLYTPRMTIRYIIHRDSIEIPKSIEVPLKYINNKPLYPSSTFDNYISFDYSCFNKIMASISEGDTNKSSYEILFMELNVLDYNPPLAKFYSSTHGSLDEYSIRLDQTTYSNINEGLGIFGVYKTNIAKFYLRDTYKKKFGYW
jgi:hypothetical protein